MAQQTLWYGIGGLVLGVLLASFVAANAVNNNRTGMMQMMGMNTNRIMDDDTMDHMGFSMDDMVNLLQGKTGDQFDATFIEQMIDHHQGAIEMAELAKQNAKHQEIKIMADDIISAQSREVEMMQVWQKQWGY